MAAKRTITATAPDGTEVSINVGPTRQVGAIRITDGTRLSGGTWGDGNRWLVTVHRTLPLAMTGSNQTTAWNRLTRYAVAIGADDQPTGPWWLGAAKG